MIFNNKENEFINIKLDSLYFLTKDIYIFYMKIIILKIGENKHENELERNIIRENMSSL